MMDFLTNKPVSSLPLTNWMIIVAGVFVLLIIVITAVSVKKHKKKVRDKAVDEFIKNKNEQSNAPVADATEQPNAQMIEQVINEGNEEVKEEAKKEEPKKEEKPKSETKPVEKKATVKKAEPKKEEKPAKRLNGKWKIVHKKDGEYIAELCASNGEVMLSSEIYATSDGAKSGIATIIKGVKEGKFVIYRDKSGAYYYKLKSAGNKLLCVGEIYKTKDGCASAVESVKRIAEGAVISDEILVGEEYIDYTPSKLDTDLAKRARGKWKIEKDENGFSARLYANNGQLMIATEGVSQKSTALNAVEAVKKNSAEGNFIIDKDKFGRFYYKLRNSQKSVICIGEAYDSLDACVSAIESVRRFASVSDVVTAQK